MTLVELDQDRIMEPSAPMRASIDEAGLQELAESISEVGLLQPILVVERGDRYEVVAGHRRLLATRILGLPRVRCVVADSDSDTTVLAGRVHENLVRRDVSPAEEAAFYAELMEQYGDVDKVCALVRRSRSVVEGRLLLLSGDRRVLHALNDGKISLAVAQELNCEHDDRKRAWFLEHAVVDGATYRTVNSWRRSHEMISLDSVDTSERPQVAPDQVTAVPQHMPCYLCGDNRYPATMRWVPVHASCQDVARRLGWKIEPEVEDEDGHK